MIIEVEKIVFLLKNVIFNKFGSFVKNIILLHDNIQKIAHSLHTVTMLITFIFKEIEKFHKTMCYIVSTIIYFNHVTRGKNFA